MKDRKDKFEEKLFQMAAQEQIEVPESLLKRVEAISRRLPDETTEQKPVFHMNFKKALLLAAVLVMALSVTVTAAVGALKQRMEEMNQQKIEEYFIHIYEAKIGHDNYNRPFTDTERERIQELQTAYEEQALFPEGELMMLEQAEDYKEKGVAFLPDTATFFLPEQEMSDEELLQIIDFRYKRDYSLMKMNEMIAAGEAEMPIIEEAEIEATEDEILQSDAVYEPEQELIIPYTGDLEAHFMAAGQNCIFLTGFNAVHKMEIGSSDSTLFFDDFGEKETRVTSLYQDKTGCVYLGLWQWDKGMPEKRETSVWVLDKDGTFLRKIDFNAYTSEERSGYLGKMVVDNNGNLYVRFSGKTSSEKKKESVLLVFDKEGKPISEIWSEEYDCSRLGGLCIGKDGKVYTQIEKWDGESRNNGVASVNLEKACLEEIYTGIVPEETIMLDIIAPGSDTDFVFWGFDGIFTYNLGDESAVNVLPAYEAPCEWEGVMNCALPDGRIVFGACTEYRVEENENGSSMIYSIPEKITFYYKSSMRKE